MASNNIYEYSNKLECKQRKKSMFQEEWIAKLDKGRIDWIRKNNNCLLLKIEWNERSTQLLFLHYSNNAWSFVSIQIGDNQERREKP